MRMCVICGKSDESERNALEPDEILPDVFAHWECQITPAYQEWHRSQCATNPAFNRYWDLMTVAKPVTCAHCDEHQAVSPKAVGMGAGIWDLNCTACHRQSPEPLNGYEDVSITKLEALRGDFLRSRDLESIDDRIRAIANVSPSEKAQQPCVCGGRYSLTAKPRCVKCNAVLFDSYFHVSYKPVPITGSAPR